MSLVSLLDFWASHSCPHILDTDFEVCHGWRRSGWPEVYSEHRCWSNWVFVVFYQVVSLWGFDWKVSSGGGSGVEFGEAIF